MRYLSKRAVQKELGSSFIRTRLPLTLALAALLGACATPHVVQTVKTTDSLLTCGQLELEMAEADRFRTDAQKEKGVTGTNVAAVIFFWPAMIGTYSNANEAIAAADLRKSNLAAMYAQKKCAEKGQAADSGTSNGQGSALQKINDLKTMLDKGLISPQEYEEKRAKIVREM